MPEVFSAHKPKTVNYPKQNSLYKNKPSHHANPLSSFAEMPSRIHFETQDNEEKIVLLLRKHIITNLGWIVTSIILFLTPFFVSGLPLFDNIPDNFMFIFILIWYLISIAYTLESFLTWFFNVYIVTDERVIDIDFYNLIYKEVSDANIDKIQDVTYKMGGAIRTVFNYGDVLIQTASEVPNFEFEAVPKPDKVAKILQDLRIEEQQEAIEGRVR
ncbi:MAG: PH domain-containing protein [bacterium]|nr:MAG: PH domain-containing protein [bacterium]